MISTYAMFQIPFGSGTSFVLATNNKNFRITKTMSHSLSQLSGDQNCLTCILPRKTKSKRHFFFVSKLESLRQLQKPYIHVFIFLEF